MPIARARISKTAALSTSDMVSGTAQSYSNEKDKYCDEFDAS
jgi:hypothetical protein